MIEEGANIDLLPLSGSGGGYEFIVQVRFRAMTPEIAWEVAYGVQEQLPSAGVVCLTHTEHQEPVNGA